ncbi:hypothetical protein ERJ75_000352200 [Trypanosoma vivax]|uniref:Uncharacterized protein n=1 Tax=Trypanosoma vivax (strain Y486) TaxID=1055687 RepID=G0TZN9_TRYVY|nr:hypothetical protein TRVL_04741 [Trypanosoma vivax]KAH8617655.1 hypothetical protein ERJ75_000352200 [Trypanosoma vivax]CCC50067.1 conserved hypothetical protein [Trypanosoma vivax Y486]
MGKGHGSTAVEVPPELAFIKQGHLNMLLLVGKDGEAERIPTGNLSFMNDPRVVRNRSMDQVNFNGDCAFKVTLEFRDAVACVEETAVRETTDWVLCSSRGNNAFYSPVEKRLVLQNCTVCLQSNVPALVDPFTIVLCLQDDVWQVERVLR